MMMRRSKVALLVSRRSVGVAMSDSAALTPPGLALYPPEMAQKSAKPLGPGWLRAVGPHPRAKRAATLLDAPASGETGGSGAEAGFHDDGGVLVRRERREDHAAVRAVLGAAFEDPAAPQNVPIEVGLVDALRPTRDWIPQLSMVAEAQDGEVVGYVVCTRGWVEAHPALALGPLAVVPGVQRQGAGAALMHAVLGAADALEEPLVALLGHTGYYPRFGFRPAAELGITPPSPSWASHFQVRTLSTYQPGLRGGFRYAQPFNDL